MPDEGAPDLLTWHKEIVSVEGIILLLLAFVWRLLLIWTTPSYYTLQIFGYFLFLHLSWCKPRISERMQFVNWEWFANRLLNFVDVKQVVDAWNLLVALDRLTLILVNVIQEVGPQILFEYCGNPACVRLKPLRLKPIRMINLMHAKLRIVEYLTRTCKSLSIRHSVQCLKEGLMLLDCFMGDSYRVCVDQEVWKPNIFEEEVLRLID